MIKSDVQPAKTQGHTPAAADPQPGAPVAESAPAAAPARLAEEAAELCADLERFFRRAFGDMPKATDVGELRAQQSAVRELVQRASGGSAETGRQLAAITTERDKLKDAATRAKADFLNYQSRTAKDLERAEELALRSYAQEMLTVLDSLDLAEKDAGGEQADIKRLKDALHLIATGVRQVLTVRGLKRMDVLGKPFDPAIHETVAKRPTDAAKGEQPNTVVEELRPGYFWHGLILRPAQVLVTDTGKKT